MNELAIDAKLEKGYSMFPYITKEIVIYMVVIPLFLAAVPCLLLAYYHEMKDMEAVRL